MKYLKVQISILIFLFAGVMAVAAVPSFLRLTVESGLSNNRVKAIYKDSFGYIWIGSLDGIDRFDGVEIRTFSSKNIENVLAIAEDDDQKLWVGTSTGLFFQNEITSEFEKLPLLNSECEVKVLSVLSDSVLCVGTSNGLFSVNPVTLEYKEMNIVINGENVDIDITGILPDNHGNCWIATFNGLFRYSFYDKKSELYTFTTSPQIPFNSFSSICRIGNRLYLGTTNSGIVEFDLSSKTFNKGVILDNNIILTLDTDKKELIYVGTDGGGLKIINTRTLEIENIVHKDTDKESLSSDAIYSFYLDDNGRYWIGTFSAGICYSRNVAENFKLHNISNTIPEINKSIRSFYFSPKGDQFFGTRNGFVYLDSKNKFNLFQSEPSDNLSLRSNIVLSLYPYGNDILIGTYGGGVSKFNRERQKIVPFLLNDISTNENVYAFDTASDGTLWIATFNGLYVYSATNGKVQLFNSQNSELSQDVIFDIMFDSRERIWVGSMKGVNVYSYNGQTIEEITIGNLTDNSFKVNFIYEDQDENIWVCTEREGLFSLNPNLQVIDHFTKDDGLPDNSVCAIAEKISGEYWISTLKGLCQYSVQSQSFNKQSVSEGIPGLVFTPAAVSLEANGILYFGNEKGLVYFTPEDINEAKINENIQITDFFLWGKTINPGEESVLTQVIERTKEIRLKDRMNSIGFRFILLNYEFPLENEYQFKLEGHDNNWRSNGTNNSVFYEKLRPGKYIFKVRSSGDRLNDSSFEKSINVIIRKSIVRSPVFFIGFILIVLVGIVFLFRYIKYLKKRIRLSQKSEKYKGARVSEGHRERIIEDLSRLMEEKKLYLNPDLKLADLADEINFPINEISQVLNKDLNQSFSDYINKFRIVAVKKQLAENAQEKFTFIAIAQQCGFNSKTSFYRIFKSETGKTPADYVKDLDVS